MKRAKVPILAALAAAAVLSGGLAEASERHVTLVRRGHLPPHCREIGRFHADTGHGKHADGRRVALNRAKKKAASAGATHAVVLDLSRGHSDLGGHCRLLGYRCPTPSHR